MGKLNNFKFQVVKNFLSKDELKIYKVYAENAHRNNFSNFDLTQNNNADTYFYKDNLFEFLLRDKIKLVEEKVLGKK